MKYLLVFFFLFFYSFCFASDLLIEALTRGKFSGDFTAHYNEGSNEDGKSNAGYSKLYIEYSLPPIMGIDITIATQSNSQTENNKESLNKIIYSEAAYERKTVYFDYRLSANYYSTVFVPNEDTQTVTSRAVGLKAEIAVEDIQAYIAFSQVSDGPYEIPSHPSLEGRDKLLPTASLLLSNNDAPNTRAAALDVKYRVYKQFAIGSHYAIASDETILNSYNGVYTSFALDNLNGLNITLAYDKAVLGKDEEQWSVQIKNRF